MWEGDARCEHVPSLAYSVDDGSTWVDMEDYESVSWIKKYK